MTAIAESVDRTTTIDVEPFRTVVNCCHFLDRTLNERGFLDMMEDMYLGDPQTPYARAQRNAVWRRQRGIDERGQGAQASKTE